MKIPPLTEGMVRKGGQNPGPSQITERPPEPGAITRDRRSVHPPTGFAMSEVRCQDCFWFVRSQSILGAPMLSGQCRYFPTFHERKVTDWCSKFCKSEPLTPF